jgi:hypothetical protein
MPYFLVVIGVLGFECRVSHLLGRCSTIWAILPVLFCGGFFQIRVLRTISSGWLRTVISIVLISDYFWCSAVECKESVTTALQMLEVSTLCLGGVQQHLSASGEEALVLWGVGALKCSRRFCCSPKPARTPMLAAHGSVWHVLLSPGMMKKMRLNRAGDDGAPQPIHCG